jgi:predicted RNase H-like nuclease (RuvC/YqgF family)
MFDKKIKEMWSTVQVLTDKNIELQKRNDEQKRQIVELTKELIESTKTLVEAVAVLKVQRHTLELMEKTIRHYQGMDITPKNPNDNLPN